MKNTFLFFLTIAIISLTVGCKNPKNADTKGDGTVTEQPATSEQPPRDNSKGVDPAERFVGMFEQMGMELSADQKQQVATIAAKYDIQGAPDREARRALLTQFQNEVSSTVLTPDQQAIYAKHHAENQIKRDQRQK